MLRTQGASERKLVTVLVVDTVGSTALAETMDPEEWTGIVFDAHEIIKRTIHQFGGTVAQFTGDGVIVFFGAPRTRQDDASRAVQAALELQRNMKAYERALVLANRLPHFRARVGLHTGMVVVGDVGNARYSEYLAVGDTVALAQRVQSAAAPGTVSLSDETARLVLTGFELEPAGAIGKPQGQKISLWQVVKSRAVPLEVGEHHALVGRTRELEILREAVARLQGGKGALVSLVGDAGVGKSRLIQEMRPYAHSLFPSIHWYEARGMAFGDGIYALFQQILRASLGITDQDSVESIRKRLQLGAERQNFQNPQIVAQMLELMLAIDVRTGQGTQDVQGRAVQAELFATVRNTKRALAQNRPTVFVLEDMQWADAASVDLTLYDADLVRELPLLIVAAFRPERDAPSWKYREECRTRFADAYIELELNPLPDKDAGLLLDELAGGAALAQEIRTRILDKTEGNPFFLEQVWNGLVETGALVRAQQEWRAKQELEIALTLSLSAVLTARIDRLGEPARRVLQAASILGCTFPAPLLQNMVARAGWNDIVEAFEIHIGVLERQQLIVPRLVEAAPQLAFKQTLIQDAAYASLLKRQRRELHRYALEALLEFYAGRMDERVSELAYHAEQGQDWARAYEFARRAAENAQRVYALNEARTQYQRALAALDKMDVDETFKQNARSELHTTLAV